MKAKYMIGTKAIHKLGDISRDDGDLFIAFSSDKYNWIGNWVFGYGLIDVKFPKKTSREPTKREIAKYNSCYVQINSQPPIKLEID